MDQDKATKSAADENERKSLLDSAEKQANSSVTGKRTTRLTGKKIVRDPALEDGDSSSDDSEFVADHSGESSSEDSDADNESFGDAGADK